MMLVAIAAAAVLELFFILKAIHEIRAAKVYRLLVDELARLERP